MRRPSGSRTRFIPVYFTMMKPAWWRRHTIWVHVGKQSEPVARFWSWDKADDLLGRLLDIV